MLWQMPQQRSQMLKRKFADWQNLLRLAASHALTPVSSPQAGRPSTTSPPNLPLAVWTGIVLNCSSAEAGEGGTQTEENIALVRICVGAISDGRPYRDTIFLLMAHLVNVRRRRKLTILTFSCRERAKEVVVSK
jgi:hypothetical protein